MRERVLAGIADPGVVGRARRLAWLAPAAVAAAVLLTAGGLGAYLVAGGTDLPPAIAPGPATSSGPATVGEAPVTNCGTFTLDQGERLPTGTVPCFVEAVRAGRPAWLAVTSPTAEGDPILESYAAGVDGRITVVIDTRRDRFSSPPSVARWTCAGPAAAEGRSRDGQAAVGRWLAFDECSEPVVSRD